MRAIIILMICSMSLFANNGRHLAPSTVVAGESIKLSVSYDQPMNRTVYLYYRTNITQTYKAVRMDLRGFDFEATIDIPEENTTGLEYFFASVDRFGQRLSLPERNPQSNPYRAQIIKYAQQKVSYQIVSPEDGEEVDQNEFMLAFSLLRVDPEVDLGQTKVFVNGANVTSFAEIDEVLITWLPAGGNTLRAGPANFEVQFFSAGGTKLETVTWKAVINKAGGVSSSDDNTTGGGLMSGNLFGNFYGNIGFESISESYGDPNSDVSSNNFTSVNFNAQGRVLGIDLSTYALISSEQDEGRQDVNRFGLSARAELFWGMYIRGQVGDFTPPYNEYMFNGENMRGIDIGVMLGLINVEFTKGVNRKQIIAGTDSLSDNSSYQRDVLGARVSIGDQYEDALSIGINLMLSKDQDFDTSADEMNINPEENLVFGPDFQIQFADGRVKLKTGGLFSVFNDNIRGGSISYADASALYPDLGDIVDEDQYDQITEYITINGIPSVGYMVFGSLDWNLWGVVLNARTELVDPGFVSHMNPYLQQDILKNTFSGVWRIFDNSVYLRGTYSTQTDNINNTTDVSTTSNNDFSFGVDFYPSASWPTVGFTFLSTDQNSETELEAGGTTKDGDFKTTSLNMNLAQQVNIAGMRSSFAVIYGTGNGESTIDSDLNTTDNNIIVNGSVELGFLPLKVFAEVSNFDSQAGEGFTSKTTNFRLNGTYKVLDTGTFNLSAYAQTVFSGTDIVDQNLTDPNVNISQNELEFGGNVNWRLTTETSLTGYTKFKTVGFSGDTDYSNTYFTVGASFSF